MYYAQPRALSTRRGRHPQANFVRRMQEQSYRTLSRKETLHYQLFLQLDFARLIYKTSCALGMHERKATPCRSLSVPNINFEINISKPTNSLL